MRLKAFFLLTLCCLTAGAARAESPESGAALKVTGELLSLNLESGEKGSARCRMRLRLSLTNVSSEPVIILRPLAGEGGGNRAVWLGGYTVYRSFAEAEAGRAQGIVYARAGWPSIYDYPENVALAKRLDQAAPPEDLTLTLAPGGVFAFESDAEMVFTEDASYDGRTKKWSELRGLPAPLWLRVSFQMWGFNVENFQKRLVGIRRRWRRSGNLLLEKYDGTASMPIFSTAPIRLDFGGAAKP